MVLRRPMMGTRFRSWLIAIEIALASAVVCADSGEYGELSPLPCGGLREADNHAPDGAAGANPPAKAPDGNELLLAIGANLDFLEGVEPRPGYYNLRHDAKDFFYRGRLWTRRVTYADRMLAALSSLIPSGFACALNQSRLVSITHGLPIKEREKGSVEDDPLLFEFLKITTVNRELFRSLSQTRLSLALLFPLVPLRSGQRTGFETDLRAAVVGEVVETKQFVYGVTESATEASRRQLLPVEATWISTHQVGIALTTRSASAKAEVDVYWNQLWRFPSVYRVRVTDLHSGISVGAEVEIRSRFLAKLESHQKLAMDVLRLDPTWALFVPDEGLATKILMRVYVAKQFDVGAFLRKYLQGEDTAEDSTEAGD